MDNLKRYDCHNNSTIFNTDRWCKSEDVVPLEKANEILVRLINKANERYKVYTDTIAARNKQNADLQLGVSRLKEDSCKLGIDNSRCSGMIVEINT